jgi:hypothetical protein
MRSVEVYHGAAGGTPDPNYLYDVNILPGGTKGSYLQCGNNQLLSYWAPGNIYSQRGTLAFDWRPRDPLDGKKCPVSPLDMDVIPRLSNDAF